MTKVGEKRDSYLAVWCFGELLNPQMTAAIPYNNNTTTHRALRKMADSFYKKKIILLVVILFIPLCLYFFMSLFLF